MKIFLDCCAVGVAAIWILATGTVAADAAGSEPLTIDAAVNMALARNPGLAAAGQERDARDAAIAQARLRPDPELRAEVEDFAGSGSRKGFDAAQSTVLLSQTFETGGKRELRGRAAELDRDVASYTADADRLELIADVKRAFVAALAAQERVELARRTSDLSAQASKQTELLFAAGAIAPAEVARARLGRERALLDGRRAQATLESARQALATFWGGNLASASALRGNLAAPPDVAGFLAHTETSVVSDPRALALHAEVDGARNAVAAEEARRLPDVTVGAGTRFLDDGNDVAAVVELSIPLPAPSRARLGATAAASRLAAAQSRLTQFENELHAAFATARRTLTEAVERSEALQKRLIPAAEDLLGQTRRAREQGRLSELDVVEAHRSLLQLGDERIEALEQMQLAAIEMERMTGAQATANDPRRSR